MSDTIKAALLEGLHAMSENAGCAYPVQRKYRRYDLRYPVRVEFRDAQSPSAMDTVSWNVSLGGMLLHADLPVPEDSPVVLTMTLDKKPVVRPLQITAEGRVVRVAKNGSGFIIAVECNRPISRIESLFATSGVSS